MTRVLIAVDESRHAVDAARTAHALFGDAAEYLVINVDPTGPGDIVAGSGWGMTSPLIMPMPYAAPPVIPPAPVDGAATVPGEDDAVDRATRRAGEVANAASLVGAQPIGDVGDATAAILDAAHAHAVDVIVVGSHEASWFSRLFAGSVTSDVVRSSDIPVLVVT